MGSDNTVTISVQSFSRSKGRKGATQYTIDVGALRDPIGDKVLKLLDGRATSVQSFVAEDRRVAGIIDTIIYLTEDAVYFQGAIYLSFAFCDHHGKFIAPAIAEIVSNALVAKGFTVSLVHQHLGGS